jgi:hypothetical protein
MVEKLNTIPDQFIRWKARWTPMFLTWVYAFWHPMHLKSLRVNRKQIESTTWTWSSTYVINYFYYIYIVCYYIDIFYLDPIFKSP